MGGLVRRFALPAAAVALAVVALAAPAAAEALSPLQAVRGAAPQIVDAQGREVLLRGVNVNQLGDYYRAAPDLDPTFPLTDHDFAGIAALGLDSVRLLVHWSALEPARGVLDQGYLERVRHAVAQAGHHGLYVVLDMHQDAWGKYVATPPGETCAPGFQPAIGWDGAPSWATLTDGLPTCRESLRELSPAVAQAFTNFYLDRDGIQSALGRTWARLAHQFASDPTVAGYDLLNEPHPGYTPGPVAATELGAYYARAIAAIRAGETSAPHGFSHIAFFEPNVTWSATAVDAVPPPGFTTDPNIAFAPHLYAGSITADRSLGITALSVPDGFALARAAAAAYAAPLWSGEWGWFGDPQADAASIAAYGRQEDASRIGGAWWDWKQACGDPHQIGVPGGRPGAVSPSLNRFACPSNTPLGIPHATRLVLSRGYPRAAPGALQEVSSDPTTGALTVRGRAATAPDPSCGLDVWVPGTAAPHFATSGVSSLRAHHVAGGWRVTACVSGTYALTRTA